MSNPIRLYKGAVQPPAAGFVDALAKTTVTNYFPYSGCTTGWFYTGNAAYNATNRRSPSGGDFIQLIDDASGGTSSPQIRESIALDASTQYTMSVEAAADQLDWVRLASQSLDLDNGGPATAFFDLSSGVLGATLGSGNDDATITDIGNGFYLCTLTFTTAASGDLAGNLTVFIAEGDNDSTVDIDGTSSIIVGNAQLEKASSASTQRVFTDNEVGKTRVFGGNVIYINKGAVQESKFGNLAAAMYRSTWARPRLSVF